MKLMTATSSRTTVATAPETHWAMKYEPISLDALRARIDETGDFPARSAVPLAAVCMALVPLPTPLITAMRELEVAARKVHDCVAQLVGASRPAAYPFTMPLGYDVHPDLVVLFRNIHEQGRDRVLERAQNWLGVVDRVVQEAALARCTVPVFEEAGPDTKGAAPCAGLVIAPLRDPTDKSRPWMNLLVEELVKVLVHFGVPMPSTDRRQRGDAEPNAFDFVEDILSMVIVSDDQLGPGYDSIRLRYKRGQDLAQNIVGHLVPLFHEPTATRRLLTPEEWVTFAERFEGPHAAGGPCPTGCIWVPRRSAL